MDPPRRQLLGTPDIVDVVGIAAVDQDVARFEGRQDVGDGFVNDGCRHHQPHGTRLLQLLDEIGERRGADGILSGQFADGHGRHIEDHAVVAVLQQPPHHVGAHAAETDHPELH